MARRNRSGGLELNFDGLADSVTNLVGALILLVVMIIGVSKDAVMHADPPPAAPPGKEAGDRPLLPLKQRIALLESEISHVDASIEQLKGRLAPLKQDVEQLLEQVDSLQPPKKEEQKPPDSATQEVRYRPPFERQDTRTPIGFVVEEDRVSFLDYREVSAIYQKFRTKIIETLKTSPTVQTVSMDPETLGSDFLLEGKARIFRKGGDVSALIELPVSRRPGVMGEPLDEALQPDSQYRRALAALDPKQFILQFLVYPDSYGPYRKLRQLAWESKFDLSWEPQSTGQQIKLGAGSGTVD